MKFNRPKPQEVKPVLPALVPVVSSNIEAVGYNDINEELIVQFIGGAQYLYKGVKKATYDSFAIAPSVGKFFHANIKSKFENVKIKSNEPKVKATDAGKP